VGGWPPPRKESQYPLYRRLGEPQDWFGQVWSREIVMPPLGFKPQTIEPIVSYADYAVLAPEIRGLHSCLGNFLGKVSYNVLNFNCKMCYLVYDG